MNIRVLEEQLKVWKIPLAVVADVETGDTIRLGSSTGLGVDDLLNNLFRDADAVLTTARSLEGQLLPRTWIQGNVSCVVCKPNETTMVGLFCIDQRNPVEMYHRSKALNSQVARAFAYP